MSRSVPRDFVTMMEVEENVLDDYVLVSLLYVFLDFG